MKTVTSLGNRFISLQYTYVQYIKTKLARRLRKNVPDDIYMANFTWWKNNWNVARGLSAGKLNFSVESVY